MTVGAAPSAWTGRIAAARLGASARSMGMRIVIPASGSTHVQVGIDWPATWAYTSSIHSDTQHGRERQAVGARAVAGQRGLVANVAWWPTWPGASAARSTYPSRCGNRPAP